MNQRLPAVFERGSGYPDWETEAYPKTKITTRVDGKPMGEALQQMLDQSNWTLLRPIPSRKDEG